MFWLSYASSICPDKIFFVQDNIEIVQDKAIVFFIGELAKLDSI